MKLYVYNNREIAHAMSVVIDKAEARCPDFVMEKMEDTWYHLTIKSCDGFFFIYPSGALWNRKIYELLNFPVTNPLEADYFLVPLTIFYGGPHQAKGECRKKFDDLIIDPFCYALPYWQYNKDRHVFFIAGDSYEGPDILEGGVVFRSSCHKSSKHIALYYDVLLDNSDAPPISSCEHSCAFVGCLETHEIRRRLPFVMSKMDGKVIFESTPNFFCYLPKDTQEKMQRRWVDALKSSQFILAPRGCGLTSIRFFEALAFGRIPVLVADKTKLPLEDLIDYDEFVVRVPEDDIEKAGKYINLFKGQHDLQEASLTAKKVWHKYFAGGKLRDFLKAALPPVEKLKRYKLI